MKWNSQALIILTAAIYCMAASAEGGCPDGQYPQQGPGWRTCVPIPGVQQLDSSEQIKAQWTDFWGAIAADYGAASLGTETAADTEESAKAAAIRDCRTKGGTHCEILMTVRNACMAMVVGTKLLNAQSGPTKAAAEQKGMTVCNGQDTNCAVYYSGCSLPQKISN